jgi:hypothetical protein
MMARTIHGPGIIVSRVDYKGRHYSGPLVARANSGAGRGFVLWGAAPVYHYPGGSVFRVCAWPDNPRGSLQGWRTLREAREWAAWVNGGRESGFQCSGPFREHSVIQARGFDAWGRHFNRAFPRSAEARSFIHAMQRGDNRVARY